MTTVENPNVKLNYWVMKNMLDCESKSKYNFFAWLEADCFDPGPYDFEDDDEGSSDSDSDD